MQNVLLRELILCVSYNAYICIDKFVVEYFLNDDDDDDNDDVY